MHIPPDHYEVIIASLESLRCEIEEQTKGHPADQEEIAKISGTLDWLRSQPNYEPVPDGVYHNGDDMTCVTGRTLAVAKRQARVKMYVGYLPDGFVMMRPTQFDGPNGRASEVQS